MRRAGPQVYSFALSAEQAEKLDRFGVGGTEPVRHAGVELSADPTGRTEVPGVWAAGNVTDPAAQVGTAAAAQINADLVAEETRQAVAAYRAPFSVASEARVGELVSGDRRHGR